MRLAAIAGMVVMMVLTMFSFGPVVWASGAEDRFTDMYRQAVDRAGHLRSEVLQEQARVAKVDAPGLRLGGRADHHPADPVRVIIELEEKALLEDFAGPGILARGAALPDMRAAEYRMKKKQEDLLQHMVRQNISFSKKHQLQYVSNAISGEVPFAELDRLRNAPGVKEVWIAEMFFLTQSESRPEMYFSAPLIGADVVWGDFHYTGEGIVVAVIDSGINFFHPAFGGDGVRPTHLGGWTDFSPKTGNGLGYSDRVIGGWNHIDHNNDITDSAQHGFHGTHVAGIVGGHDEAAEITGRPFLGVAPEVRFLAEKVFSTNSLAPEDAIMAAIEHAVLNGARVINMSLGAPAGVYQENRPYHRAVEKAVEQGVVVVVSAGNSSYSTADISKPYAALRDFGMVGAPSIVPAAISVAASMNEKQILSQDFLALDPPVNVRGEVVSVIPMIPVPVLPSWSVLPENLEFVHVGLGNHDDDYAGKDVDGKVALILRGKDTFKNKIARAEAHGAVAAIVYNNVDSGLVTMGGLHDEGIPAAFILKEHGDAIAAKLDGEEAVRVTYVLGEEGDRFLDLAADTMATFSSWGPEPALHMKPSLTGPGGEIYSAVDHNRYESKSGTSMSAPHVAGAAALVLEASKHRGLDYTPFNVATVLANTSRILINPETMTPYPVRHQGAGRIQVDQAVQSSVLVTGVDGAFGIALKEFGDRTVVMNLTAKNAGSTDVVYHLAGDVYQDRIVEEDGKAYNSLTLEPVVGARVSFDRETLLVPAGGQVGFTATLTLPESLAQGQFVDGWLRLTADAATPAPDLVVPYFGFYGDWNQPAVIDAHWSEESSFYGYTGLGVVDWDRGDGEEAFYWLGRSLAGEYVAEYAAFSPDVYGSITVQADLLRNSSSLMVSVLDGTGEVLEELFQDTEYRKNYQFMYDWDGAVQGEVLPDGAYLVRLLVQPYGVGGRTQEYRYPVKLDRISPELTAFVVSTETEAKTLRVVASDDRSGIWGVVYTVYDEHHEEIITGKSAVQKGQDGYKAAVDLPEETAHVYVTAWDHAGNKVTVELEYTQILTGQLHGVVNLQRAPDHSGVVVALYDETGNQVAQTVTGTEGEYRFTGLEPGLYRLEARKVHYLAAGADDVAIAQGVTTVLESLVLWAGDFDGDNKIDILDLALLAQRYGTGAATAGFEPGFDLNGDLVIDLYDLVILAANSGKVVYTARW